jgi:hypothetical protein
MTIELSKNNKTIIRSGRVFALLLTRTFVWLTKISFFSFSIFVQCSSAKDVSEVYSFSECLRVSLDKIRLYEKIKDKF